MGIFGRKASRARPASAVANDEIKIVDSDISKAQELLQQFSDAQISHTDWQARSAVLGLARAGDVEGSPAWAHTDVEYTTRCMQNFWANGTVGTDRPWRWLSAVAGEAARRSDDRLVALTCLFTFHWINVLSQQYLDGDEMELRLPKDIDEAVRATLFSTGLQALSVADQDQLVAYDPEDSDNSVPIRNVVLMCAIEAEKVQHLLQPEVAAQSANILERIRQQ